MRLDDEHRIPFVAELAGLRRSMSAGHQRPGRTVDVSSALEVPGPGSYEPLARIHDERKRVREQTTASPAPREPPIPHAAPHPTPHAAPPYPTSPHAAPPYTTSPHAAQPPILSPPPSPPGGADEEFDAGLWFSEVAALGRSPR